MLDIEKINGKSTKITLTDGTRLKAVNEGLATNGWACKSCYFIGKDTCAVAPCVGVIWVKRKDKK